MSKLSFYCNAGGPEGELSLDGGVNAATMRINSYDEFLLGQALFGPDGYPIFEGEGSQLRLKFGVGRVIKCAITFKCQCSIGHIVRQDCCKRV